VDGQVGRGGVVYGNGKERPGDVGRSKSSKETKVDQTGHRYWGGKVALRVEEINGGSTYPSARWY